MKGRLRSVCKAIGILVLHTVLRGCDIAGTTRHRMTTALLGNGVPQSVISSMGMKLDEVMIR